MFTGFHGYLFSCPSGPQVAATMLPSYKIAFNPDRVCLPASGVELAISESTVSKGSEQPIASLSNHLTN